MFFVGFLFSACVTHTSALPNNEMPMYGEQEKTPKMLQADAEFVASIEKKGISRKEGAKEVVQLGWSYFAKKKSGHGDEALQSGMAA